MKSNVSYPEPPNHIDKHGQSKDADGRISKFTILDEICIHQTGAPGKLIYLQKSEFENKKIELRLCYFRIGKVAAGYLDVLPLFYLPTIIKKLPMKQKEEAG